MKLAKGLGVSKGKVKGTVRVISSTQDALDFQEGEILVTTITDPTMVPAMNKSVGILCSIGGLMSHPSILSREMGLPCIVQAKNEQGIPITELVSTGDCVEFNGETGEVFVSQNTDWIDEYVKNFQEALGDMDFSTLKPVSGFELEPLIAKYEVELIERLKNKVNELGISYKQLADAWPTTTGIRNNLFFFILELKIAKIPKQKRLELCNFFYNMLKERAVEDVVSTNSTNITRTKEQVKQLLKEFNFKEGSAEDAKLLGKLSNAAYNFAAGLFTDNYLDIAAENEGPYDVSSIYGPGHTLVVRRYVGLQSSVWPDMGCPMNDLSIFCVYKDVKFVTGVISCHSMYEGDVLEGLVDYAVVADGRDITNSDLKNLLERLETMCVKQWHTILALSKYDEKKMTLSAKRYGMRKLFELVDIDWKPSKEVLEAIKKPRATLEYWNDPKIDKSVFWTEFLDPRKDIYPFGEQ